jgi:hypothetical protein
MLMTTLVDSKMSAVHKKKLHNLGSPACNPSLNTKFGACKIMGNLQDVSKALQFKTQTEIKRVFFFKSVVC